MKNLGWMKHTARATLFVMIVSLLLNVAVFAQETVGTLSADNGFVEYTVNQTNGRFTVATVEGATYRDDSDAPLLYEEYYPDTSFTTFMIDGEAYVFGNDYGPMGLDSVLEQAPTTVGLVTTTIWNIKGVQIKQIIQLDEQEANAGNVLIRYEVINDSGAALEIGSRMLLDTMLGSNDGAPISIVGSSTMIDKETYFEGDSVPIYWKAYDQKYGADIVAYGLLSGWRSEEDRSNTDIYYNASPDAMLIGHWAGLSGTKWEYNYDTNLNFTSENNVYGTKDSGVALYWNPHLLQNGGERVYETYYGLGEYATIEMGQPVNLTVSAPEKLTLNSDRTQLAESSITINGVIDNALEGSERLENVFVTLSWDEEGLSLASGNDATKTLIDISPGQVRSFEWKLNTSTVYRWINLRYTVTLSADNLDQDIVRSGEILIPPATGLPPDVKLFSYSPAGFFYTDETKILTLSGQNLQGITYDKNYSVILTNTETGEVFEVGKDNINVGASTVTITIPKALNFTKKGKYQVRLRYSLFSEEHVYDFEEALVVSADEIYRTRFYGILMVIREGSEDNHTYKIVTAQNESELKKYDADDIILDIRAGLIEYNEYTKVYTIRDAETTLNSLVTVEYNANSSRHDAMTIEMKENDLSHEGDYIRIMGSADLYIHGQQVPFMVGPYLMDLVDGSNITSVGTDYPYEDYDELTIQCPLLYKGTVNTLNILTVDGLPVTINEAILRSDSISLGGGISLYGLLGGFSKLHSDDSDNTSTNTTNKTTQQTNDSSDDERTDTGNYDFGASIMVDDLRFGLDSNQRLKLLGLKANGSVGIPKDLVGAVFPGVDLGAQANFEIDTFDNWRVALGADVFFVLIETNSNIQFKLADFNGVKIPLIDEFYIYGGLEPGIPIIPSTPVVFLQGLGGGMSGIYDTITGNFNYIPPWTLKATASAAIAKVLEIDRAGFEYSLRGAKLKADGVNIGKFKFFKDLSAYYYLKDKLPAELTIGITAGFDIADAGWITGNSAFSITIKDGYKGNLGPLKINGSAQAGIQIPNKIWLIGGKQLGNVQMGITEEEISGQAKVFGFIPVSVKYVWGGEFTLSTDSDVNAVYARDGIPVLTNYDDTGNVTSAMYMATNFHVVQSSKAATVYVSAAEDYLPSYGGNLILQDGNNLVAYADTDELDYLLEENIIAMDSGYKHHTISINDNDYSIIEIEYTDEQPNITLTDPNGQPIALVENDNYVIQAVDENTSRLFIMLENPMDGDWTVDSDKDVNVTLVKVDAIPEITSVSASVTQNELSVQWDGNLLDQQKVSIQLISNDEEGKNFVVASDIDATLKTAIVEIPDLVPSGSYYVSLVLYDSDRTVQGEFKDDQAVQYSDPLGPPAITNLAVENYGNGLINVTWDDAGVYDGYFITATDQATGENDGEYQTETNEAVNVVGGTYVDTESNEERGLIPGKTYKITVNGYNTVDGYTHLSSDVSKVIYISIPEPASIDYEVTAESGETQDLGMRNEVNQFLINDNKVTLNFSTDQNTTYEVYMDGSEVFSGSGYGDDILLTAEDGEHTLTIEASNDNLDRSNVSFDLIVDTKAPVLRIDTPEQTCYTSGEAVISGYVDLNSTLTIDGEPVSYDAEGLFTHTVSIGENMTKTYKVEAIDEAGNATAYEGYLVNSGIDNVVGIAIIPAETLLPIGTTTHYEAVAVDETGNEFKIASEQIEWRLMKNEGVFELSEDGSVRAVMKGKDVLIASFKIANDYAFEEAVIISSAQASDFLEGIEINPNNITLSVGQKKSVTTYGINMDQSTFLLNNTDVSYSVTTGSDIVSVDASGMIQGNQLGTAIIKATYETEQGVYEDYGFVTVSNTSGGNDHSNLDAIDVFILKVLQGINGEVPRYDIDQSGIVINDGRATVRLSKEQYTAYLDSAPSEFGRKKLILVANTEGGLDGFTFDLPSALLNYKEPFTLTFVTAFGEVTLSQEILKEILEKIPGDSVQLTVDSVSASALTGLSEADLTLIGGRPIYRLSYWVNGNAIDWNSAAYAMTLRFNYAPREDEASGFLVVLYISDDGDVTLIPSGKFNASGQMVTFRTRHFSTFAVGYQPMHFTDLESYDWARDAIESLGAKGIINGTGSGKYSPASFINKAEMLTLLVHTLELGGGTEPNYTDVQSTDYFYEPVAVAESLGIDIGSNGYFRPYDPMPREALMILMDACLRNLVTLPAFDDAVLDQFSDADQLSEEGVVAATDLVSLGIFTGDGTGLAPERYTSRAEAAVLIYKLYQILDELN